MNAEELKRKKDKENQKPMTTVAGAPVGNNQDSMTAGPRGPMMLQDVWFLEKMSHFDREVIPERRMHAKGSGAFGTFTVTHDITQYTKAKIFSEIGKQTEMFVRFSTVAGERGADRHRHLRRAGAEGDHCEADHQRRHAEGDRQPRGAAHQQFGADDEGDQAEDEHQDLFKHG